MYTSDRERGNDPTRVWQSSHRCGENSKGAWHTALWKSTRCATEEGGAFGDDRCGRLLVFYKKGKNEDNALAQAQKICYNYVIQEIMMDTRKGGVMKLSCLLKKAPFQKAQCDLTVNGEVVATLVSGRTTEVELSPCERYYVTLGDKVYGAITVLIPEGETMCLTVTKQKKSFSLDAIGARVQVISLARFLGALCDEGKIPYLSSWEKTVFFVMLFMELNRQDAILESPFLLEIKEALFKIGENELGERLCRAIEACEIDLPLSPMKKLTPEEETALVESYHILWGEEEQAPPGEERRVYLAVLDYIFENQMSL